MNLILLDTFRIVIREGSALRAAEKLGCTQSNVTARIRQLEDELGAAVFERVGKRLALNAAGRRLLPFCDQLLELMSKAKEAVLSGEESEPLRIGAMESTAASRLPGILAGLKRAMPELHVSVRIGAEPELLSLLVEGELDVALTARSMVRKGFRYLPVFNEELDVACACDMTVDDLLGSGTTSLLAFAEGCPYRKIAEDWLRHRNIGVARTLTCTSYDAIVSCAAAGMGIAILPRRLVASRIANGELGGHAFADLPATTTYCVTAGAKTADDKVAALLDYLKTASDNADRSVSNATSNTLA
jgi:DNA-binding transcriptional LysR family regulator